METEEEVSTEGTDVAVSVEVSPASAVVKAVGSRRYDMGKSVITETLALQNMCSCSDSLFTVQTSTGMLYAWYLRASKVLITATWGATMEMPRNCKTSGWAMPRSTLSNVAQKSLFWRGFGTGLPSRTSSVEAYMLRASDTKGKSKRYWEIKQQLTRSKQANKHATEQTNEHLANKHKHTS